MMGIMIVKELIGLAGIPEDTLTWWGWMKPVVGWMEHPVPSWLFFILGLALFLSALPWQRWWVVFHRRLEPLRVTHPAVRQVENMRAQQHPVPIDDAKIESIGRAYGEAVRRPGPRLNASDIQAEAWQLECLQKTGAANFTTIQEWDALLKWIEDRHCPHPFKDGKYCGIDALDLFRHANRTGFDLGDANALYRLLTNVAIGDAKL